MKSIVRPTICSSIRRRWSRSLTTSSRLCSPLRPSIMCINGIPAAFAPGCEGNINSSVVRGIPYHSSKPRAFGSRPCTQMPLAECPSGVAGGSRFRSPPNRMRRSAPGTLLPRPACRPSPSPPRWSPLACLARKWRPNLSEAQQRGSRPRMPRRRNGRSGRGANPLFRGSSARPSLV